MQQSSRARRAQISNRHVRQRQSNLDGAIALCHRGARRGVMAGCCRWFRAWRSLLFYLGLSHAVFAHGIILSLESRRVRAPRLRRLAQFRICCCQIPQFLAFGRRHASLCLLRRGPRAGDRTWRRAAVLPPLPRRSLPARAIDPADGGGPCRRRPALAIYAQRAIWHRELFCSASSGFRASIFLGDTSLALPTLIVIDVWQWTPFTFLILFAALQGVPEDVIEAAKHRWRAIGADFLRPHPAHHPISGRRRACASPARRLSCL